MLDIGLQSGQLFLYFYTYHDFTTRALRFYRLVSSIGRRIHSTPDNTALPIRGFMRPGEGGRLPTLARCVGCAGAERREGKKRTKRVYWKGGQCVDYLLGEIVPVGVGSESKITFYPSRPSAALLPMTSDSSHAIPASKRESSGFRLVPRFQGWPQSRPNQPPSSKPRARECSWGEKRYTGGRRAASGWFPHGQGVVRQTDR